mmetsp:Transcript_55789/g.153450  ORF Transcript_55789/g.153450 Transcript_55789/m.153450 type:complete len:249 (+) Transcript_55789:800-1546(+)
MRRGAVAARGHPAAFAQPGLLDGAGEPDHARRPRLGRFARRRAFLCAAAALQLWAAGHLQAHRERRVDDAKAPAHAAARGDLHAAPPPQRLLPARGARGRDHLGARDLARRVRQARMARRGGGRRGGRVGGVNDVDDADRSVSKPRLRQRGVGLGRAEPSFLDRSHVSVAPREPPAIHHMVRGSGFEQVPKYEEAWGSGRRRELKTREPRTGRQADTLSTRKSGRISQFVHCSQFPGRCPTYRPFPVT